MEKTFGSGNVSLRSTLPCFRVYLRGIRSSRSDSSYEGIYQRWLRSPRLSARAFRSALRLPSARMVQFIGVQAPRSRACCAPPADLATTTPRKNALLKALPRNIYRALTMTTCRNPASRIRVRLRIAAMQLCAA